TEPWRDCARERRFDSDDARLYGKSVRGKYLEQPLFLAVAVGSTLIQSMDQSLIPTSGSCSRDGHPASRRIAASTVTSTILWTSDCSSRRWQCPEMQCSHPLAHQGAWQRRLALRAGLDRV